MERERQQLAEKTNSRYGVSLKELIPYAVKRHKGKPGPSISPRIGWLNQVIEKEGFWIYLNKHLAEDAVKRQSVGGVFTGKYGKKPIGPYMWKGVFSSLDTFLKEFDFRATEFLFRDFQPENPSSTLARIIDATRELAINKYPRLRRLMWDDYEVAFETPSFWRRLAFNLEGSRPQSVTAFFCGYTTRDERLEKRERQLELIQTLRQQPWTIHAPFGKKARYIEYQNLFQMLRDRFGQDPRTFLLNYTPTSKNPILINVIKEAKELLEKRILPVKDPPEAVPKMNKKEVEEAINNKEFWLTFLSDLENHTSSQKASYSLSYFLRYYDRESNEITGGKLKSYAKYCTANVRVMKNLKEKLLKPSQELGRYLMWEFQPPSEIEDLVVKTRSLCAEMFPNDCFYVILQSPDFWKDFKNDVLAMKGKHTLCSFLRYFSRENTNCERKLHRRGKSKYQRLLHKAYHRQRKFLKFLKGIGIKDVPNYKEGIAKLFWKTAPDEIRELLKNRFPDYQEDEKEKRVLEKRILNQAKAIIKGLREKERKEMRFASAEEAADFRAKLWSGARSLKIAIMTNLDDCTATVELGKRVKYPPSKRAEFEAEVKKLRLQGLLYREIAEKIGNGLTEDNIYQAIVKLKKRGEL